MALYKFHIIIIIVFHADALVVRPSTDVVVSCCVVQIDQKIEQMFASRKRVSEVAKPVSTAGFVPNNPVIAPSLQQAPSADNLQKLEIAKRLASQINAAKNLSGEQDNTQQVAAAILRGDMSTPQISVGEWSRLCVVKATSSLSVGPLTPCVIGFQPWGQLPRFGNGSGYHFWGISGSLESSGNLCGEGNLIVAAQQNNSPVLYSYCNSFLICHVHGEFGLIKVHLFDISGNFVWKSRGKVRIFVHLENGNPEWVFFILVMVVFFISFFNHSILFSIKSVYCVLKR